MATDFSHLSARKKAVRSMQTKFEKIYLNSAQKADSHEHTEGRAKDESVSSFWGKLGRFSRKVIEIVSLWNFH